MSGLLYYLPGRQVASPAALEEFGLGYVLDAWTPGVAWCGTSAGPDGQHGVVFAAPAPHGEQGAPALADSAAWHPIPGSNAWVGVLPGGPKPVDLQRKEQLQGHMVRLSDDREWRVPVARRFRGTPALPCAVSWDGSRWSPGQVVARYRELWDDACRVWDQLVGAAEGQDQLTLSVEASLCVRALAINYRVGPAEVSALGLLDTKAQADVLLALVDWPSVKALADSGGAGAAAP